MMTGHACLCWRLPVSFWYCPNMLNGKRDFLPLGAELTPGILLWCFLLPSPPDFRWLSDEVVLSISKDCKLIQHLISEAEHPTERAVSKQTHTHTCIEYKHSYLSVWVLDCIAQLWLHGDCIFLLGVFVCGKEREREKIPILISFLNFF